MSSMSSGTPNPAAMKTAVLLLFKSAPPIVLYPDNPEAAYEEFKAIVRSASPSAPKLIERSGSGPIRKVAFWDSELLGVSLQAGVAAQF